jgi:hypothetical protein
MRPERTDPRVAAEVERVRALAADQARAYLNRLRETAPELYEEVVDVLDAPTSPPEDDRTADRRRRAVLTATAGPNAGIACTCAGTETFMFGRSRRAHFYYYFDEVTRSLIGRKTKRRYRLGDKVHVTVVRVDLQRRQLDFRVGGRKKGQEKA